jgi:hypothetical protein
MSATNNTEAEPDRRLIRRLHEIDSAAANIEVDAARYPEHRCAGSCPLWVRADAKPVSQHAACASCGLHFTLLNASRSRFRYLREFGDRVHIS